jgi:hypothetical protein
MFESEMAGDEPRAIPPQTRPTRTMKRAFTRSLTLLVVGFASFLVWGVVANIQESADRID